MKKFAAIAAGLLAAVFLLGGCGEEKPEERDPAEVLVGENPCDIYFATGNDYYDLYAYGSWMCGTKITLLSREEIAPETIQVSLDIQTPYTVEVICGRLRKPILGRFLCTFTSAMPGWIGRR